MEPILSTHQLSFCNRIDYPDMTFFKNEITFISGPSGCGKSTLFKLMNAAVSPSAGLIKYAGTNISSLDKIALRREILLVNQVPYLFRGSILDNFSEFHRYHESRCPSVREMTEYLKLCCIDVSADALCDTMSGGERQRVFLSIALSLDPAVFLLDEPTSALHFDLSKEVMEHMIHYANVQNKTLLVISHDTALKNSCAEAVVELGGSL